MNVFLSLDSSDFLIEYIYSDISPSSPDIINTDTAPFYLMENGHNGSKQLMNQDGLESFTNNTRNRSVAQIEAESKKFALLTTNKLGIAYNDYDNQLTDTTNLPLPFSSNEGVVYDTVRVHLIQGFSFNDYFSGISLDISIKDKTDAPISLLSTIYKVQDNFEIMNPNPFLYSGRQYSSYIEYKIPSLKYLIDSYITDYVGGSNSDILSYKITNGNGFYKNTLLEITGGRFSDVSKVDNQFYTTRLTAESTSISSKDDFSDIGVYVNESNSGDYIEFYGTHNGEIFGDYMQRLNTSGTGRYIAIHKLTITEQLPNTTGEYTAVGNFNPITNVPNLGATAGFITNFTDGDYWVATETGFNADIDQNVNKGDFVVYNPSLAGIIKAEVIDSYDIETYADIALFIRSGDQEFIQDDNFGEENLFRPVLKFGGSALSYRIEYTLQIYNTNTNTTIEKRGSYISFQPQKYGKELLKLNTRDNIQIFDVFNKKVINNIINTTNTTTTNAIEDTSLYSKNITSFKQVSTIYSGVKEVSINTNGEIVPKINPDSVTNVLGQGLSTVYISPFDTFLQFAIYEQNENNTFRSIDLNKIGEVFLNFTNKNGEIIKIDSTKNVHVDESKGQILFRVKSNIYNQIINSGNDVFFITSRVGSNSPETPLYTGKYKEYSKINDDETQMLIDQQRQTINDLNTQVTSLENTLTDKVLLQEERNKRRKNSGGTADDKTVGKNALNIKNSTFNPYGPTNS
jgi:hypothetical protein